MSSPDRLAQAFAAQMRQWAQGAGAGEAAQALAAEAGLRVSLALGEGHTCLAPGLLTGNREAWLATGVIGTPERPGSHPLILDDQQRLYLHRYYDYEHRLALRLRRLCVPACSLPADPEVLGQLQLLLQAAPMADSSEPDWQALGAALALLQRFTLISGGPGTGKTSTVVRLLACLLVLDPATRIVLAAPTGKAAARMQQAVQARADTLPDHLRAGLTGSASTLHRLLGAGSRGQRFRHDAHHRLPLDVLVVDEASMLDLSLATHLFEAVPDHARVILLGDKDQLAAVQSGAVFAELGRNRCFTAATLQQLAVLTGVPATRLNQFTDATDGSADDVATPPSDAMSPPPVLAGADPAAARVLLRDSVVWFTRQYRFTATSPIGRLASHVRAGSVDETLALLTQSPAGLQWLSAAGSQPTPALQQALLAGYEALFAAVESYAAPGEVFAAFETFRVLCAVRSGPWGAQAFNQWLAGVARSRVQGPSQEAGTGVWYRGRPVLVLRNDPLLGLFNGDIGLALPDAGGELQVVFPQADGTLRWIAPVRLPEHETAYAMTIHKSQGSEFDAVAVVLPAERAQVLSRELLYTGITRARQQVLLQASPAIVQAAVQAPTVRSSGLLARLAGTPQ